MTNILATRELVRCAARRNDLCYIMARDKQLSEDEAPHTSLIAIQKGKWAKALTTDWNATAIAVSRRPDELPVFIGEDGEVCTFAKGSGSNEQLTPKPVMIRHARTIDGEVHACGMRRQVYRRVNAGVWVDISAPTPSNDQEVGFESIDGYSAQEVYAVGWAGEIWQFDGTRWSECASPTNVILTAVCCAADGVVYAAGQQGVMLRGRRDAWAPIDWEETPTVDLWDLCWFQDKLYVASINNLYTLEGRRLVPVDFGDAVPTTCYSLSTAEGVLWSIGRDDAVSFDGQTWRRYD